MFDICDKLTNLSNIHTSYRCHDVYLNLIQQTYTIMCLLWNNMYVIYSDVSLFTLFFRYTEHVVKRCRLWWWCDNELTIKRSVAINSGGGLASQLMQWMTNVFSKFATVALTMKDPRLVRTVRDSTILWKTVKYKVITCIRSSDKIVK